MLSLPVLRLWRTVCVALIACIALPAGGQVQPAPASPRAAATPVRHTTPTPPVRVYLDCRTWGCDRDLFITEVKFATLTRDRADADVHLLVTALNNGAGGRQLTLQFIGLGALEAHSDTAVTTLPPNVADDVTRREIIRVAKLGLVPFAMHLPIGAGLRVDDSRVSAVQREAELRQADPWNFWVLSVGASGGSNAESRSSRGNAGASINARRVTDLWKINLVTSGNYRQSTYELSDSTRSTYILRDYGARGRIVRNAGAHWSTGVVGNIGHTDFANQDAYARLGATIEYSIFPWSQAATRQLVAAWQVAVQHFDYVETTIYLKDRETLPHQQAIVAGSMRQPWGNVDLSANWSQYLSDPSKNHMGVSAGASLRITRGLAINVGAFASSVHDQLYLPRGDASDEQILTQQRALATSFVRGGSLSVSYTFGSIYNTIVNPRLDVMGGF